MIFFQILNMAAADQDARMWPGYTGTAHPEKFDIRAKYSQTTYGHKPGQLTEDQVKQYFEEVNELL